MDWKTSLTTQLRDVRFTEGEPLDRHTTFRIGGPAALYASPESEDALCRLLDAAVRAGAPVLVLGNGSNLLVRDGGFDGRVVHLSKGLDRVTVEGTLLTAGGGALLSRVAVTAMEHGLAGLAFAHGIPGSVGGGVYMNAGAYGGEMAQVVETVKYWTRDGLHCRPGTDMAFGYRHSRLMEEQGVVLSASFRLTPGSREQIQADMRELMARRKEKQPLEYPSAGSFFKRPTGYFAGALIEQAGLKGFSVGGAQVSEKHAGFIVNRNHATARDVIDLMEQVQQRVQAQAGVKLENEVRIVGSDK